MKTMKFRLLATMITLAAVTTATTTLAQRSSDSRRSGRESIENRNTVKSAESVERKNAYRDAYEPGARTSNRIKSNEIKQLSKANSENRNFRSRESGQMERKENSERNNSGESKNLRGSVNFRDYSVSVKTTAEKNRQTERYSSNESRRNNQEYAVKGRSSNEETGNNIEIRSSSRVGSESNRAKYHLDADDRHYKINNSYRGNNKYWTSENRNISKSNLYINNSYNNFYWDRGWESYCWNKNSWVNYYSFYSPYAYRHHKYYYYHHRYGHVISRFASRPPVFIYNNCNYYCYDGHFFRYFPSVGYVLVDMPFGLTFEYIPTDYQLVHINGYLYFRVGNLFFEYLPGGYRLVHYPERYYAWDAAYCNGGLSIEAHIF